MKQAAKENSLVSIGMTEAMVVNPNADAGCLYDDIVGRVCHLEAGLALITGQGFSNFVTYNDRLQDEYLMGLFSLAASCRVLLSRMSDVQSLDRPHSATAAEEA